MIIVDMNLSPEWAPLLTGQGWPAQHWGEIGPATAEDRMIFDHARTRGAMFLTQDLDFGAILASTNAPRPSVILLRLPNVSPAHAGAVVVAALKSCARELAAGAILSIDDDRQRVRLLPFQPESLDS